MQNYYYYSPVNKECWQLCAVPTHMNNSIHLFVYCLHLNLALALTANMQHAITKHSNMCAHCYHFRFHRQKNTVPAMLNVQ